MRGVRLAFAAVAVVATGCGLLGCGNDAATVPSVVGLRLDDAHNALSDAGFEKVDDVDAIEDRDPLVDANWVVLSQAPAAGDSADPDDAVKLEIAKPEDAGVRERLPEDSPVLGELRARDEENTRAEAEQDRRDEEARRSEAEQLAKDRQEFVDNTDPTARVAKNAIIELNSVATQVENAGSAGLVATAELADIKRALDYYWGLFEGVPDAMNDDADKVQEAIREFQRAADTLLSVEGASATDSLDRYRQVYGAARDKYNQSLSAIYAGTTVPPPLV